MEPRPTPDSFASTESPQNHHSQQVWFANEVLPHDAALRNWLRSRYPSLGEGDDVVQESYLRLIRAKNTSGVANAKAYLFTIARNVTLDLFRRRQASPIESREMECAEVPDDRSVPDSICSAQEYEILQQAIDSLPERCRAIMTMQKIQGLSNGEIARRLGLSVHTVNAQLVIGLARCRKYLLARGVLRAQTP